MSPGTLPAIPGFHITWTASCPAGGYYGDRIEGLFFKQNSVGICPIDLHTGTVPWSVPMPLGHVYAGNSRYIIAVPLRGTRSQSTLVGLEYSTGAEVWRRSLPATSVFHLSWARPDRTGVMPPGTGSYLLVRRRETGAIIEIDPATGRELSLAPVQVAPTPIATADGILAAGLSRLYWLGGSKHADLNAGNAVDHMQWAPGVLLTLHRGAAVSRIWDLTSGQRVAEFRDPFIGGLSALSPDLVVCPIDKGRTLFAWDVAAGRELWRLDMGTTPTKDCTFLGPYVVASADGQPGALLEATTGRIVGRDLFHMPHVFDDGLILLPVGDKLHRLVPLPAGSTESGSHP